MPHIHDPAILLKIANLISMRADGRAPSELADVIIGMLDLTDLFPAALPRRIQLLSDTGPAGQLIWASNAPVFVYPLGNFIGALIIGSSTIAGVFPLTRIDVLSLSFVADQPSVAGTRLDIWQSDDGPGGGIQLQNPATGAPHPSAGSLTLTSNSNPDTAAALGTNALRLRASIPIGIQPANVPYVVSVSGDFIASVLPLTPANFNRRILFNIRNTALAGPYAAAANIFWQASVRVTP